MESITTSCPIIRDEVMALFERVEVNGSTQFIPFEQRILWLRQSETKVTLEHRGVQVKEVCDLNDYYGYLSSILSVPKDEGERLATALKLDASTDLVASASVQIKDTPVLIELSNDAFGSEYRGKKGYRQTYRQVPSYYNGKKWWYTSDQLKDADDKYSNRPVLESVIVLEVDSIWTNRDGVGEVPRKLQDWVDAQKAAITPINVYASLATA